MGAADAADTSIAVGLDLASALPGRCGCEPARRVIDVSGDGPNNTALSVTAARGRAITVNGLAIAKAETPAVVAGMRHYEFPLPQLNGFNIADYNHRNVIGGPDASRVSPGPPADAPVPQPASARARRSAAVRWLRNRASSVRMACSAARRLVARERVRPPTSAASR